MPKATVRMTRDYDSAHFDVSMTSDEEDTLETIHALPLRVAVLVNEMVERYKAERRVKEKVQMQVQEERLERVIAMGADFSDPFEDTRDEIMDEDEENGPLPPRTAPPFIQNLVQMATYPPPEEEPPPNPAAQVEFEW